MAGLLKRLKPNEQITINGTTWVIENKGCQACTIRIYSPTEANKDVPEPQPINSTNRGSRMNIP